MHGDSALWKQEENFWTSGLEGAHASTTEDAIMVFPYPTGILQGDRLWSHLRQQTGWRTVKFSDRSATHRGAVTVLAYRVSAEKAGVPIYQALCASTYMQDGDTWLRMSHQQTPLT